MPNQTMCSHCDEYRNSCLVEKHTECETCGITSGQGEKDIRAPLVMGHFPFFRLPFDIRRMVYEEVFKTPRADKTITPDPSYHRRRLGRRFAEHTVHDGQALLQSCQQAHEEATEVLYGNKFFYFDDESYGTIRIEASAHCHYCSGERLILPERSVSMPTHNRCRDAHDSKHYVGIPRCDFVSMYDWLFKIGERNRLKIRHIHISFSSSQFAKVLGEWHLVDDPLKPSPVGGDLIEKALELLAHGHNLDTFGVSFRRRYLDFLDPEYVVEAGEWQNATNAAWNWTAFERIFSTGLNHRLKNALSNIKGIRKLSCDWASVTPQPSGSWSDEGANALEGFKEVKECMETGYADRQMVETVERTPSIPCVDQARRAIHDCKSFKTILSGDGASEGTPDPISAAKNSSHGR